MWSMILSLSSHDYNQLLIWAKQAHPQECCGLIWAKKNEMMHVDKLELTKNIANNPLKYFEIDPKSLFDANRKNRSSDDVLIGIFHSHPNGLTTPSYQDAMAVGDVWDASDVGDASDASDVGVMGDIWIIIGNGALQAWMRVENGEIFGKFNPIIINIINK